MGYTDKHAVRTEILDKATKAFIHKNPDSVIVILVAVWILGIPDFIMVKYVGMISIYLNQSNLESNSLKKRIDTT